MKDPNEDNLSIEAQHIQLATDLARIVEAERSALTSLQLGEMTKLTEQRIAMSQEVIELAKAAPVPDEAKAILRRVHRLAQDNVVILESSRSMVRTMLDGVTHSHTPTYAARPVARKRVSRGVLVWKG